MLVFLKIDISFLIYVYIVSNSATTNNNLMIKFYINALYTTNLKILYKFIGEPNREIYDNMRFPKNEHWNELVYNINNSCNKYTVYDFVKAQQGIKKYFDEQGYFWKKDFDITFSFSNAIDSTVFGTYNLLNNGAGVILKFFPIEVVSGGRIITFKFSPPNEFF